MWNHLTTANDKKPQQVDWDAVYEENERLTKEKWAALPPIVKGFYEEHPEVKAFTDQQVDQFRRDNNNIVVSHFKEGDTFVLPKPATKFEHAFHNHADILEAIASQNFKTPSPIQAQAWPILLQGKDLIGIAQTGTGKTLAYLLPGLLTIVHQTTPRHLRPGPTVLILAPTRELAQQIDKEAKKYSYQNIKSLCIYGGGNRGDQIAECRKKPEIVIATPGRLNDLTSNNLMDLTAVNYVVLDEADRMLDMGFMPQIRKILVDIRPDRQTVMMSATWPPGVRKIANDFMNNPAQIFVGTLDLAAVNSVSQEIVMTEQDQKRQLLYDFLLKTMTETDKAIVFVGRKSVADDISSELALNDIACQCMHGDRDQADRERALADFKSGRVRIIIATDVASRGLDIDDITYILNYDFPSNAEEYVHRVGRTGRAGRTGKSITFFTREDWRHAKELIDILSNSSSDIPQELQNMAARFQAWQDKKRAEDEAASMMGGGGRFRRDGGGGGGFGRGGGGGRDRVRGDSYGRQPRGGGNRPSRRDDDNWTTGYGGGGGGGGSGGSGGSGGAGWTSSGGGAGGGGGNPGGNGNSSATGATTSNGDDGWW